MGSNLYARSEPLPRTRSRAENAALRPFLYDLNAGTMKDRICQICGKSLEAKRSDARFCSVRCQVRAHRKGKVNPTRQLKSYSIDIDADAVLADPRRVLAEIAADRNQPAAARVSACRTLLTDGQKATDELDALDPITRKAIGMLNASRRLN